MVSQKYYASFPVHFLEIHAESFSSCFKIFYRFFHGHINSILLEFFYPIVNELQSKCCLSSSWRSRYQNRGVSRKSTFNQAVKPVYSSRCPARNLCHNL